MATIVTTTKTTVGYVIQEFGINTGILRTTEPVYHDYAERQKSVKSQLPSRTNCTNGTPRYHDLE